MARYNICHELNDATLTRPFATFNFKRYALQAARAIAKSPVSDASNVVVMDNHGDVVVVVLPIKRAGETR